jgi:AcrR family transcriptional regulator
MTSRSTVALTRAQLYRRVWSKPLTAVATEMRVSSNALAKICNRLLVPYPSRGYWARVGGGKSIARPPLPAAPESGTQRVTISAERSASRRTRTRMQPTERREQLIGVAREIILAQGLHAASMKHIAAKAGISETQAYNYFGSREKLFIALAISESAKIQAAQRADISQFKDHYEQVIASTRTYLRQTERRAGLLQMLNRMPEVRAGVRQEFIRQTKTTRPAHVQHLVDLYGVPREVAVGCTVILSRLCGRAAKIISDKKLSLIAAERMCLAIVLRGSRSVLGSYRDSARRTQGLQAA